MYVPLELSMKEPHKLKQSLSSINWLNALPYLEIADIWHGLLFLGRITHKVLALEIEASSRLEEPHADDGCYACTLNIRVTEEQGSFLAVNLQPGSKTSRHDAL